ncbi:hypothetical protein [uncultured Flavobacterium sp.]|nr:hypothetical protein [uncultured Flavobacterium sp.]
MPDSKVLGSFWNKARGKTEGTSVFPLLGFFLFLLFHSGTNLVEVSID